MIKKTISIVLVLVFICDVCQPQNIKDVIEKQKQEEIQKKQAAEKQRQQEEQQRQAAERQKQNIYLDAIASAEKNYNLKQYEQAKRDYQRALEIRPENAASLNPKIAEIDRLIIDKQYQDAISSAETNFTFKSYSQAKENYRAALKLKPENAAIINPKIDEIDILIKDEKYNETIASAENKYNRKQYEQAKQDYKSALAIKPENSSTINSKIQQIDRLQREEEIKRAEERQKAKNKETAKQVFVVIGVVAVLVLVGIFYKSPEEGTN